MSNRYLLDASAVLALIAGEPGADRVRPLMAWSAISGINLAEVVKKLREKGVPRDEVEAVVSDLQIPVESGPSDVQQAIQVGEIAANGRAFGLSMGDAVCLATAGWSGLIAVTAERRWTEAMPDAKILAIR
jgi:PIN domain nuclease of toxin-antitoxin system